MQISEEFNMYEEILIDELRPAMGCTEPIAIAYAAAIVSHALGQIPERIDSKFSANIIKNVKSVIVPMTKGRHGIETAIVGGLLSGRPDLYLEVLTILSENAGEQIDDLCDKIDINVGELNSSCSFEIRLLAEANGHFCNVDIVGEHTGVERVTLDGIDLTAKYKKAPLQKSSTGCDKSAMSVGGILKFASECDLSTLSPLLQMQIDLNMAIAEEGLNGSWGASIGRIILDTGEGLADKAKAYAAAGSDARMSGCEMAVCIISGSGNQGITASVPVIVYANELNIEREKLYRALIVSNLITVHQKTGIGTLSAYCGAISAGVGAAAGICYLLGGDYSAVSHTVVNAVAILSGTICDGAKPSCAAKIAMAVEAGLLGYRMARSNKHFQSGDGIVTSGVESTIRNIGRLAKDGMQQTDKEIIRIMLEDPLDS